jgi:hypothetical protein
MDQILTDSTRQGGARGWLPVSLTFLMFCGGGPERRETAFCVSFHEGYAACIRRAENGRRIDSKGTVNAEQRTHLVFYFLRGAKSLRRLIYENRKWLRR